MTFWAVLVGKQSLEELCARECARHSPLGLWSSLPHGTLAGMQLTYPGVLTACSCLKITLFLSVGCKTACGRYVLPPNTVYDFSYFRIIPEPRDGGAVYSYINRFVDPTDNTIGKITYEVRDMLPSGQQYVLQQSLFNAPLVLLNDINGTVTNGLYPLQLVRSPLRRKTSASSIALGFSEQEFSSLQASPLAHAFGKASPRKKSQGDSKIGC